MNYTDEGLKSAQKKLIGAWQNADGDISFFFDLPRVEFNHQTSMILRLDSKIESIPYFIHFFTFE